ncbi:sensor histidine kinase [Actinoplanes sp. NPDC000266]
MFNPAVQRFRDTAVRHPLLLDAVLGLALAGPAMAIGEAPAARIVAVLACLAVAVRRRWPAPVLAVTATATIVQTLVADWRGPELMIALLVCVYTVATRTERQRMWLIAAAIALPLYLALVATSDASWWAPQNITTLAGVGMATAVGDATSSRRAYVAEVEERARRAEQSRDDEARRRVFEERIRIARELHDVVSHHIAVINVQAGAARHVMRRQPAAADSALEHIRHASDTVLRELGSIVGVLRQAGDLEPGTEPVRGLARLPALLDTVAAAGLKVGHQQHGEARALPVVVDLAAFRIVQEALTNAQKHGTGTACLTVSYTPREVVLEVVNPIGTAGTGSGYGLIGMRERVTAAGGTLEARHRSGDEFRLRAVLPAPKTKDQL